MTHVATSSERKYDWSVDLTDGTRVFVWTSCI